MSKVTSIALDDHHAEFVDRQLSTGDYASASDVVRAGLRLLEERAAKVEALRAALIEGEGSGVAEDFDFDKFLAEMHREHGE